MTIPVRVGAYQTITARKTMVKNRSMTSVSAELVMKLRMVSSSRTRATESPARRASNQAIGSALRWRNKRAPSSTSMRLVVCEKM